MSLSVSRRPPSPVPPKAPEASTGPKPAPKQEAKAENRPAPEPRNPRDVDTFEHRKQTAPANRAESKPGTSETQGPSRKSPAPPKDAPPKQGISGEDAAKQEVKLKTVAGTRQEIEKSQETLRKETTTEVKDLFAMAEGKKDVPKDMEVKKVGDDRVEMRRKGDKGGPSEFTVATLGKDGELTLNSAAYKDGVNTRDRIELGKDGATHVEKASWKSDKNEAGDMKSLEDIKKSRDTNVSYSSDRVSTRDEGGQKKLSHDAVKMEAGGVTGSTTTFEQQKKRGEWIDNKLKGPFDFKKPVDLSTTMSYSIPPPGQDGKQEPPTFSKVHNFSQDNVTATSYVDRVLDGHAKLAGEGPHTVADFEKVRDEYKKGGGEKWDANKTSKTAPPKRWTVDLQENENTLKNQTFVEGYPDATVSTTKTRNGNEVKETYEGQAFDPNSGEKDASKLYDVKGETTKVYDKKYGSLERMDSKITEPNGAEVEQRLEASTKETDRGLETSQKVTGKRTKDGKSESTELNEKWLTSNQGQQLLSASGKVVDAEGREAIHEVGEDGEKMRIKSPGQNVRDVSDPEKLGDVEKELMATAAATNAERVSSALVNGGGKAIELLKGAKDGRRKPTTGTPPSTTGTPPNNTGTPPNNSTKPSTTGTPPPNNSAKPSTTGTPPSTTGTPPSTTGTPPSTTGTPPTAASVMPGATKTFGSKLTEKLKGHGGQGLLGAGGVVGVVAGAMGVAQGVRQGNDHAIAKGVMDMASGAASLGEAGAQFRDSIKGTDRTVAPNAKMVDRIKTNVLKGPGAFGAAGAVFGVVGGALDIAEGTKGNDKAQVAKGAVNIVGAVGGLGAAIAGGPIGMVVGGAIALGTFVFGKIMDAVSDKAHKIAELTIDDK